MPNIFSWTYHSAYARTRGLNAPLFGRSPDATEPTTAMPAPGDAVVNMNATADAAANATAGDKQDTLFGPNVGIMSAGPKWTEALAEKKSTGPDELTPEIVKAWIDKSKEPVQPTTTLQALVNLKRPTLRLTPLQHDADAGDEPAHDHHALEFEFDADAPKCLVQVHVVPPSSNANANAKAELVPVFEGTFDGGFGRALTLADGAMLELGRFDGAARAKDSPSPAATPALPAIDSPAAPSLVAPSSAAPSASATPAAEGTPHSRRFTIPFRRRHAAQRSVAGPAIAVLDANDAALNASSTTDQGADEERDGVRARITLVALDAAGAPVAPANGQATYLHVVRYGLRAVGEEGEDSRPWVVKVVKREATIGPHTFHLHEIYGLSSSAHAHTQPAPTAPLPDAPTTYPPTSATPATPAQPIAAPADDEPSSECLLCLSAPREVVLLPCRHLVACKECALNMVEFGAGGQIVHNEEPSEAPAATTTTPTEGAAAAGEVAAAAAAVEGGETPAPAPAAAPVPAPTPARRKRRAKGWFCPVCRQPYTSLLRITTVAPHADDGESQHAESKDDDASKRVSTSTAGGDPLGVPTLATPAPAVTATATSRPGFLRGLTGGRGERANEGERDAERMV